MTLGGLLGFVIGISLGLAQDCAWPTVLWRASVAACLSGLVLRWFGGVWVKVFHQAQRERQAAVHPVQPAAVGKART